MRPSRSVLGGPLGLAFVVVVVGGSVASAQPPDEEEQGAAIAQDEAPAARGRAAPTQPEPEPEPAPEAEAASDAPPEEGSAEADMLPPPEGESTVINEREEALRRAQAELMAEEEGQTDRVHDPDAIEGGVPEDSTSHQNQVGLRIGVGHGFLFAARFKDGPNCSTPLPEDPALREDAEDTFCARAGEPMLDFELSFGATSRLEVTLFSAFGLTDDPAAEARPLWFGAGIRGLTAEHAMVKGFFGLRLVIDYTKSDAPNWSNVDFGLRPGFGLTIDPARWIGIWLGAGVQFRFLRGFWAMADVSGGVQFRFP